MSSRNLIPGAFLLGMAALFLGILYETTFIGGASNSGATKMKEDDPLEAARETLAHDADVSACRAALQQVNLALGARTIVAKPPALDAKDRERLKKDFNLTDDDLSEVGAETYTLLDGWHLGGAFLFHDAATHALEPEEVGVALPAPASLERATAAFAWTMREVRLAEPTILDPVPSQFALRRGSGTPLERALVFIDLLDQISASDQEGDAPKENEPDPAPALLGCLVALRDKPGEPWACGVVVNGGPDLYLFDPRLGLPVPGADGKGVATLGDVCRKPALLDALKIEGAPPYDVTGEQARTAELQLVCSLSSLAPRMEHLQKKLLPPLRVSLSHDLDRELHLLNSVAAATEGGKPTVKIWTDGGTLLRRFLAPDEGGADIGWSGGFPLRSLVGFSNPDDQSKVQMRRLQLFRLQLAPWDVMPAQFHDLSKFPYNVGLGLEVRDRFLRPFARIALEPQGPRDRMLRGDFDKGTADLVSFSARMDQQLKRRAEAGTDGKLEKAVDEWVETARHAYADQLRAQDKGAPSEVDAANKAVEAVWNRTAAEPVQTLLEGASAVPGLAETTYQLGLCKHEKAEQAQTRLELLARRPGQTISPLDAEDARNAWMDALGWWKKYGDDHPEESVERPSSCPGRAAAVRQMRARAQTMLGDWRTAAATYEDLTQPMSDLEKLAARFRARQLRQEHGAEKP